MRLYALIIPIIQRNVNVMLRKTGISHSKMNLNLNPDATTMTVATICTKSLFLALRFKKSSMIPKANIMAPPTAIGMNDAEIALSCRV